MDYMAMLDETMVSRFQKITSWFESLTGINCFLLARILIPLAILIKVWHSLDKLTNWRILYKNILFVTSYSFFTVMAFFFIVAWLWYLYRLSFSLEKLTIGGSVSNPLKVSDSYMMIRSSGAIVILLLIVRPDLYMLAFIFYFGALLSVSCDPLPPGTKSKLSLFIDSFRSKSVPIPVSD